MTGSPSRSAALPPDIPEVAAARAALDHARAQEQASPSKEAALAVDAALASYQAAVWIHRDEVHAAFRAIGDDGNQDAVRDHDALSAILATEGPAPVEPFASGSEAEPNNAAATATPVATLDPCTQMAGAINPIADIDLFSFTAAAGDRIWVFTDTGNPPPQVSASRDSVMDLLAPDGVTVIENDDDDGTGNGGDGTVESALASVIAGRTLTAAGTHFLRLIEFGSNDTLDPYRLYAVVTKPAQQFAEIEPNDAAATAQRIVPAGKKVGVVMSTIAAVPDQDFYSFPANFGDRVLIVADGDPERDGVSTDIDFQLRAPDGVTVLATAASSTNSGGFTGEGLDFNITAPGTYFVRVTGAAAGSYHLMVSNCTSSFCVVAADCSDGNVCTNDACNPDGSCSNTNNALACDDGLFCNGADVCAGGACTNHAGDPCVAGAVCNNVCNEGADNCAVTAGTACGSATDTFCTDPDTCDGLGSCRLNDRPDGFPCVGSCGNNVCSAGACIQPAGTTCRRARLYGAAYSGANGPGSLYTIDPATGAPTLIGPIGFQRVSAIDFGPDGRLYGVGERNDGSNVNVLFVIDTTTGAGKEIGPTGVGAGSTVTDISFRKSDGVLYAYKDIPDTIVTINVATGASAAIGPPGTVGGGNGIAYGPSNILYLADTNGVVTTLYRINQTTGAATAIAPVAFAGFPGGNLRINAMDAEPSSGVIFTSVNAGSGGGGPNFLATIDTATGAVSNIGQSVNGLDALAWQPARCPTTLYGAAKVGGAAALSTFYRIDPVTGVASPVGPIGFSGVSGMDTHPQTRVIYAVGRRPVDQVDVLIKIDPVTGTGTQIGPLVNTSLGNGGVFDASFRSDGTLFVLGFDPGSVIGLFTVNLNTGLATEIGPVGNLSPGNAIGFSLSDSLFQGNAQAGGTLWGLGQTTGAATAFGAMTYSGFPALVNPRTNAMDFDPTGGVAFVSVNDGSAGAGPNYLATLDVRTRVIRRIGQTVNGLDAVTWRSDCDDSDVCTGDECARCEDDGLYGSVFSGPDGVASLVRINPATGGTALVGSIGFQRVSAMDFDDLTGLLYGTGERNDGSNVNVLLTIDSGTGAGTEVGPTGIQALGYDNEPDISFRNSDGRLYAYLDNGDNVGTLNTATGAVTDLGNSGVFGVGNGLEFSRTDVLFLADGVNLDTINQTTGAATVGPALSYVGFPAGSFRINALDANCAGTIYAIVNAGGTSRFLATVNPSTGVVTNIGATASGADGIAWRTAHGFCRNSFLDADSDGTCDPNDCAPGDPSAFAPPGEVAVTTMIKNTPTQATYNHTNADGGSGTVHDVVGDLFTNLPVGPGGGAEISNCAYPGTAVVFTGNPNLGEGFWLVIRGHNACGAGSYGGTHTNPGPPLNGPPRATTTCP